MRIGMEEAALEDLPDHRFGADSDQQLRVEAHAFQVPGRRGRMPVDELHGEHPRRGVGPVDGWDHDAVVVGEELCNSRRRLRFAAEVELAARVGGQLGDRGRWTEAEGLRTPALQAPRHQGQQLQVAPHLRVDSRPLNLDRDGGSVEQGRAVDLR
jgi:hypothetical protein